MVHTATGAPGRPPRRSTVAVDDALVDAALLAAGQLGLDVADVPIAVIARHAGVSRSTLLRRLGGTRAPLDEAVRLRGVDPGGTPPVRIRAMDAAATLIGESGLAAATLEAIAARANCSVPSLYAAFGGRDGLLLAIFERHSPVLAFEEFAARPGADLRENVQRLYRVVATTLGSSPRVAPAMLAEAFARPDSPAVQSLAGHAMPRMLGLLGGWLASEIRAGRIRELPLPLLVQQLVAPMMIHMFLRPLAIDSGLVDLPDVDTACEIFADNFVRAVGIV